MTEKVFKLREVSRKVILECAEQFKTLRTNSMIGCQHIVLNYQLQEERKLSNELFDFIFAIHDGDGKRLMRGSRFRVGTIEGVGDDVDELLPAVFDDLVGTDL